MEVRFVPVGGPAPPGRAVELPPSLLARMTEHAPIGVVALRRDLSVLFVNDAMLRALRVRRDEVESMGAVRLFVGDTDVADALHRLAAGELQQHEAEVDLVARTGEVVGLSVVMSAVEDVLLVRCTEVTARREAPCELRTQEARYRMVLETLPGVVYVAEPGPEGRWSYVGPNVEQLLGYTPAEWMADPTLWLQRLHPDDRSAALAADIEHAAGGALPSTAPDTYRMLRRDGSVVWVRDSSAMVPDETGQLLYHGVLTDVTREKALEDRLAYLASHDQVTGLPNAATFTQALATALVVEVAGRPVGVVYLDLDRFKEVNDTFGHACGDALLHELGRALSGVAAQRPGVLAARLGGDEFALLVVGADAALLDELAHRVLLAIGDTAVELDDQLLHVGVSVGTALHRPGESAEQVVAAADRAMYRAKARGGSRAESAD